MHPKWLWVYTVLRKVCLYTVMILIVPAALIFLVGLAVSDLLNPGQGRSSRRG